MKKTTKKSKKIIFIIFTIVIIFTIICAAIINRNKKIDNTNIKDTINSIDDFDSIEKVAKYLDCEFIKETNSKDKNFVKDEYIKIKYKVIENGQTNERFYRNLIEYASKALNYINYRIIGTDQEIVIAVYCNNAEGKIKKYSINGEYNYFEKLQTKHNASTLEETPITNLSINSSILNYLINNDWKITDNRIGTQDSIFENYKIFFDEGIELRRVDGKVFNIIFTKKYKNTVINNINTNTSNENIIKALGEPTFKSEVENVIGYKGKDMYAFFSNGDISIYKTNSNEYIENVEKIINNFVQDKNFNTVIQNMQNDVPDYDYTLYYGKNLDISYALKGIKISTVEGIVIYKNYMGNIYDNINLKNISNNLDKLPSKINIKNEDAVFLEEARRVREIDNKIFNCSNYYDETANVDPSAENKKYNNSKLFCMNKKAVDTRFIPEFISLDGEYADSQLMESVDWAVWMNDSKIIYGIKDKGIYIYDAINRKYNTVIEDSKQEFKFLEYKNGILKYDDKQIDMK